MLVRKEASTEAAMLRRGRLVACALVLLVLQGAVMHRFSYGALRLDLLLLLSAYLALEAAEKPALVCALLVGVLRDMASAGRPGQSAILLVLAATGVVLVRDKVYRQWMIMQALFVFTFVLCFGLGEAAGTFALVRGARPGTLLAGAFGQALLTAAATPVAFLAFGRIGLLRREHSVLV
ncbi:MAG: rod shape-determining protein MreD [Candidatus Brocadiia bacterium]|jgi:rod shape-determining protein MreD|nr:rod shape-determining protein MreD [Candidatus Brocadiia bacterium]